MAWGKAVQEFYPNLSLKSTDKTVFSILLEQITGLKFTQLLGYFVNKYYIVCS